MQELPPHPPPTRTAWGTTLAFPRISLKKGLFSGKYFSLKPALFPGNLLEIWPYFFFILHTRHAHIYVCYTVCTDRAERERESRRARSAGGAGGVRGRPGCTCSRAAAEHARARFATSPARSGLGKSALRWSFFFKVNDFVHWVSVKQQQQ